VYCICARSKTDADKLEVHFPSTSVRLCQWLGIIERSTKLHNETLRLYATPTATWALWISSLWH